MELQGEEAVQSSDEDDVETRTICISSFLVVALCLKEDAEQE